MNDRFTTHAGGLTAPASHAFVASPHDSTELSEVTRALYVGGAGNLSLVMQSGATVTLAGVAGGTLLPLRVRQVRATGTTATSLVGLV